MSATAFALVGCTADPKEVFEKAEKLKPVAEERNRQVQELAAPAGGTNQRTPLNSVQRR